MAAAAALTGRITDVRKWRLDGTFTILEDVAAPLDRSNVDTDQDNARRLFAPRQGGYQDFVFHDFALS